MTISSPICHKPELEPEGMPEIERLIPQRAPVLLVDRLLRASAEEGETCYTVTADGFFIDDEGCLAETGLLEHIAQSASALAGWRALQDGALHPPLGFIGEVKKFCCYARPAAGSVLHTVVRLTAEADGVWLMEGETRSGQVVLASTRLKVAVRSND